MAPASAMNSLANVLPLEKVSQNEWLHKDA